MAGVADLLLGVPHIWYRESFLAVWRSGGAWKCWKKKHGKDPRAMYSLSLLYQEIGEIRGWIGIEELASFSSNTICSETVCWCWNHYWCCSRSDWEMESRRFIANQTQNSRLHRANSGTAVETYTKLLAVIQLRTKSLSAGIFLAKVL